ncbi:MAG: FkbM family methyltransferase, partial [Candidatus Omnitrophota bacterium]|nr:FkbM family methyltransferase [Candidatus Omnitrophota bacterium]
EENVRLNNADKNIHIFNRGVSGKRGARRLFIDHNNPGGHSMFNGSGGFIEIDTVSLSDIFDDNGLSHCDFLKMDCEGAEYEILYNTPLEYLKRIKSISMEYHDNGDISGLASFLEENGFKVTFKKNKDHLLYAKRI